MFRSDFPDRIRFRNRVWHDDQIFTVDGFTFQIRQICCNGRTPLIRLGPVNSLGTAKTLFVTRTGLARILDLGIDHDPIFGKIFRRTITGDYTL